MACTLAISGRRHTPQWQAHTMAAGTHHGRRHTPWPQAHTMAAGTHHSGRHTLWPQAHTANSTLLAPISHIFWQILTYAAVSRCILYFKTYFI
jgi:hypothetical protein